MDKMTQSAPQEQQGVDLQYAAKETAAWRNFMDSLEAAGQQDRVYSYFIPIGDIFNIINIGLNGEPIIPNIEQIDAQLISGVRAYFALRQPGENRPSAQEMLHLYMVPVDQEGNDILTDNASNSTIYDTTLPCPNLCGGNNPLNSDQ